VFIFLGSLLVTWGRAVGLPAWVEPASLLFLFACLAGLFILRRGAKKRGELAATITPDQRLRKRWLFIPIFAIVTLSGPLWLPLTGITLPLWQRIISSVGSCAFGIAILLFATRETQPKA